MSQIEKFNINEEFMHMFIDDLSKNNKVEKKHKKHKTKKNNEHSENINLNLDVNELVLLKKIMVIVDKILTESL